MVVLRLDGVDKPEDPDVEACELERIGLALGLLDQLDASGAPGCWRAVIAGRA